jgi:hypothetical protein
MRAEKIRPPSFVEPGWSFTSPNRDRPPGSPPSVSLAAQIANVLGWIAGRRPDLGERSLAGRIVASMIREADDEAEFAERAQHAEQPAPGPRSVGASPPPRTTASHEDRAKGLLPAMQPEIQFRERALPPLRRDAPAPERPQAPERAADSQFS